MSGAANDQQRSGAFVPAGFDPPRSLKHDQFRLEPLGPHHNERDYEAWTSSIEYIQALPGFEDSNWPHQMSLEENLADLERHAEDFADRTGFTYSILDGDDVIGCLYIYPTSEPGSDAQITSWVTQERAGMDAIVRLAIRSWIETAWPFRHPSVP